MADEQELLERLNEIARLMAEMLVTVNQTHVLVNSRMSKFLETVQRLAEAQEQVESDKAEKRGIAIGRRHPKDEPPGGD